MIRIMADSAADISAKTAKELNIEILPFMINFNDKSILADINLTPDEYYEILRTSDEIPSTSQMSPGDIEDRYRALGADGNSIIHITISGNGSGTYNTSCMVANQLNDEGYDITVIDSEMFSYVIGHAVENAARMAAGGSSKEEIIAYLTETYHRDTAYFVVDDLTHLHKGGRIKSGAMAISTVLDIKPILSINDGMVEAYKKVRGIKKAMSQLVSYAEERMDTSENDEVIILHADAPDKVEILQKMIEDKLNPAKISVIKVGPIITTHVGLGVVGIYFKHKKPYGEYENN